MEHAHGARYVIAMVGLPARGKTYTSRKLAGYLSWLGHATRVFNVGERRRLAVGTHQPFDFFDPANLTAEETRAEIAMEVLDDLVTWLSGPGEVAIFDATNTTRERRASILERCQGKGFHVLFVEIIEDDPEVVDANVRETKLSSPDYAGVRADEAVRDFRRRISLYERVYEPVEDDEGPPTSS